MKNDGAFKEHRGRSATLEDVAEAAGVSPATVSRYLNNPEIVSRSRRARVKAAIDKLNYVPHGAARSLASRRSRMIGAVFPSLESTLFGGALEALQTEIAAEGYSLVVASSGYDPQRESEHIQNLVASGVDALMLVGSARAAEVYQPIARRGIPYVLIWVAEADGGHPCIGFDNRAAAAEITGHLLDMGHRRIAVISGLTAGNDRAQARIAGIRQALEQRRLSLPDDYLVECPFGVGEGRDAFRLLMSRQPRPTAVVCGSEPLAYGAIFEGQALGLDIPGEVSVTGFDDMWLAGELTPALTTIRTPKREMGRAAGQFLLSRLAGKETAPLRPLGFDLVVRDSTAPPQAPQSATTGQAETFSAALE